MWKWEGVFGSFPFASRETFFIQTMVSLPSLASLVDHTIVVQLQWLLEQLPILRHHIGRIHAYEPRTMIINDADLNSAFPYLQTLDFGDLNECSLRSTAATRLIQYLPSLRSRRSHGSFP